jgi:20S proteasome subunit alpha 4
VICVVVYDSYDRAITVFSPNGELFQVQYAMDAVKLGNHVVGITGKDCCVIAVERRSVPKLQDPRTVRKILQVDNNVTLAFAGLSADARVLIRKVRVECQSYRLTCEDAPSTEYVSRFIARTQQRYTQRGGVRPFGVASLVAGFSPQGQPQLFMTEPSGTYTQWKANVIGGRNTKNVREWIEGKFEDDMDEEAVIRLAVHSLTEVVDSGSGNISVAVLRRDQLKGAEMLEDSVVDAIVAEIESEGAEEKKEDSAL